MRVRRSQHLERYRIRGGNRLHGEVEISGAKNAAVAIIPAALMVNGKCRIENLPQISDTEALLLILESLGAKVEQIDRSTVEIDATNATWMGADYDRMRKIRASYYFVGSMLGRFGIARTTMPGGCNFGVRPIDQHVKGMNALGAEVDISDFITAHVPGGRLRGASVYLDKVSVGATMNIMIAAVLAEGRTIIENAAREPHIVDLANFLNSMGADVRGAGTDAIKVNGVEQLHGGTYTIIPDQIEAGTYMAATAAVGGEVLIKNVIPKHLDCITAKLREMGVTVEEYGESVLVRSTGRLRRANVKTQPYPGFPTDMQPQIGVALAVAEGTSVITEGVWDHRYQIHQRAAQNGRGRDQVDGTRGGRRRRGNAARRAPWTRATCARARRWSSRASAPEAVTLVEDIQFIERGYENFVGKLRLLGADIRIIDEPDGTERGTAVAG